MAMPAVVMVQWSTAVAQGDGFHLGVHTASHSQEQMAVAMI
jgi:hypothetical protein